MKRFILAKACDVTIEVAAHGEELIRRLRLSPRAVDFLWAIYWRVEDAWLRAVGMPVINTPPISHLQRPAV